MVRWLLVWGEFSPGLRISRDFKVLKLLNDGGARLSFLSERTCVCDGKMEAEGAGMLSGDGGEHRQSGRDLDEQG